VKLPSLDLEVIAC